MIQFEVGKTYKAYKLTGHAYTVTRKSAKFVTFLTDDGSTIRRAITHDDFAEFVRLEQLAFMFTDELVFTD